MMSPTADVAGRDRLNAPPDPQTYPLLDTSAWLALMTVQTVPSPPTAMVKVFVPLFPVTVTIPEPTTLILPAFAGTAPPEFPVRVSTPARSAAEAL